MPYRSAPPYGEFQRGRRECFSYSTQIKQGSEAPLRTANSTVTETGGDSALGFVDFSLFPHLDHEDLPRNTMGHAEKWAAGLPTPCYAIDDQAAIKVTDGADEVVSEGHWKLFTP